ncbi:MAG: hypothetical protein ACHQZR_03095 [Candidatus Limnocylindrales bacterium]
MRQAVRLFWRTSRFEILAGIVLSMAFTAGALLVTARLQTMFAAGCGDTSCLTVEWINLNNSVGTPLLFGASLLPLAIGLLFGPAVVGGELERGTALFAWSLIADRSRWLLWRAAPPLVLVALLLIGPALAADRLEGASQFQFDPNTSFMDFGARGPLLVMRGVLVCVIGLAAGAYLGRTLPALLLTAGIAFVLLAVGAQVRTDWVPRSEVPRDLIQGGQGESPLDIGEGFRLPDGRLLTYDESAPLRPAQAQLVDSPGYTAWLATSGWQRVFIGIRGTELAAVELREGLASAALAVVALFAAAALVRRRRPLPGLAVVAEVGRGISVPSPARAARSQPRWRRSGAWLTWRMATRVGRPEIVGALVAAAMVTTATVGVIMLLHADRVAGECLTSDCIGPSGAAFNALSGSLGDWLYPLLGGLPFLVGALLGVPLVAREFETGTGRLAWALRADRTGWLLWRLAPLVPLTVLVLVPAAVASTSLPEAILRLEPSGFYGDYAIRGGTLLARAFAMLGIGVLAGAMTRRIVPALVVSAVAGLLLYTALDGALNVPLWVAPVALPSEAAGVGFLQTGNTLLAPDGSWHDPVEVALSIDVPLLRKTGPGPTDYTPFQSDPTYRAWIAAHDYQEAVLGLPATDYTVVVMREAAALIALGAGAVTAAAVVIRRCRPGA